MNLDRLLSGAFHILKSQVHIPHRPCCSGILGIASTPIFVATQSSISWWHAWIFLHGLVFLEPPISSRFTNHLHHHLLQENPVLVISFSYIILVCWMEAVVQFCFPATEHESLCSTAKLLWPGLSHERSQLIGCHAVCLTDMLICICFSTYDRSELH